MRPSSKYGSFGIVILAGQLHVGDFFFAPLTVKMSFIFTGDLDRPTQINEYFPLNKCTSQQPVYVEIQYS